MVISGIEVSPKCCSNLLLVRDSQSEEISAKGEELKPFVSDRG